VGPGNGFGEESHTQAQAGELRDHAGVGDLEGDAGPEPRAGARIVEVGAQAGARGQADQRPVPDGVQGDGLAPGQDVTVADGDDQRLVDDDLGRQLRRQRSPATRATSSRPARSAAISASEPASVSVIEL